MRDPKRIKRILNLIEEIWKVNPELRFGQIVELAKPPHKDFFYFEDDDLEEVLTEVSYKIKSRREK